MHGFSRWRLLALALLLTAAAAARAQCPGQWLPMSPSFQVTDASGPGSVYSLLVADLDGDGPDPELLIVGGSFTHAGGIPAQNLAAWDGRQWRSFGVPGAPQQPGVGPPAPVLSIAVFEGELVVGLWGGVPGSPNAVYRRTGDRWLPLGATGPGGAPTGLVWSLTTFEGQLIAAGNSIARWNGSEWNHMTALGSYSALGVHLGVLYAGGDLFPAPPGGGLAARYVARWDGSGWLPINNNQLPYPAKALLVHEGSLIVGAAHSHASSVYALEDGGWTVLGFCNQCPNVPITVWDVASAGGTLYAAGLMGRFAQHTGARLVGDSWIVDPGSPTGTSYAAVEFRNQVIFGHETRGLLRHSLPTTDFDHDGASGTDADIEAFFACLAGSCCPTCGTADFNSDGDTGTDADIEAFFRVLAGGTC